MLHMVKNAFLGCHENQDCWTCLNDIHCLWIEQELGACVKASHPINNRTALLAKLGEKNCVKNELDIIDEHKLDGSNYYVPELDMYSYANPVSGLARTCHCGSPTVSFIISFIGGPFRTIHSCIAFYICISHMPYKCLCFEYVCHRVEMLFSVFNSLCGGGDKKEGASTANDIALYTNPKTNTHRGYVMAYTKIFLKNKKFPGALSVYSKKIVIY
jgi:hypothetical protein